MSRRSLSCAALLALAAVTLCLAGPAHAQGTGSLYSDLVCAEPRDVPAKFTFEESFIGLPDCAKLCAAARAVCRRNVDDAASCQLGFAKDFIAFDSRLDCAAFTGARLADCKRGWAADLAVWRNAIRGAQGSGRLTCDSRGLTCLGKCTGQ